MAADVPAQNATLNPCCSVWKDKCLKLDERRKCLRQAVNFLNEQVDKIQEENTNLKKATDEQRAKAEILHKARDRELAAKISLENEVHALKSEILKLRQKGSVDAEQTEGEVKCLQDLVSKGDREKDIKRQELLEIEKRRVDTGTRNAESAKKEASEAWELVQPEKVLVIGEVKNIEELPLQLEALKNEANDVESRLLLETIKCEESGRTIGPSREVVEKEQPWKYVVSEGNNPEEYCREVEMLKKEIDEVKSKLEHESLKHEEANRSLEAERSKVIAEHGRAESEKNQKEREYARRVSLESEISKLKAQISVLLEKEVDSDFRKGDISCLKNQVSEGEEAIKQLKQLLEKEKRRADLAKHKAEAEKKSAAQAWESVKVEKAKMEEEINRTNIERKKADNYYLQLGRLKIEAEEAKSKLVAEALKFEEANRRFEAESLKLTKERRRADVEMAKAEKQRKIAEANGKKIVEEKSRTENLSLQLADARQTIEKLQIEIQKCAFSGDRIVVPAVDQGKGFSAKSEMMRHQREASAVLKFKEAKGKVDAEMLKGSKERKRADFEKTSAKEQRKFATTNVVAAMEEKSTADQLSYKVDENKHKVEDLEKKMLELVHFREVVEASPTLKYIERDFNTMQVSLLKEKLKLEKMRLKHAKQVAKFEKNRSTILHKELSRLRIDFSQLTNRLDILDRCFSPSSEDKKGIVKGEAFTDAKRAAQLKRKHHNFEQLHMCPQDCNEILQDTHMDASSNPESLCRTVLPFHVSGLTCTDTISGINSKLESLPGGSDRKLLQSSAINSSSASFSDGQLIGSQEKVPESDKIFEEHHNIQTRVSCMSDEGAIVGHNGNHGLVAENTSRGPNETIAVQINRHGRKKSMFDGIESVEFLNSKGKKDQLVENNLSDLHHVLGSNVNRCEELKQLEFELRCNSGDFHEKPLKKCKVSKENNIICDLSDTVELQKMESQVREDATTCRLATLNNTELMTDQQLCRVEPSDSHRSDLESLSTFGEGSGGDYMKLLELDDIHDEELYRRAIESPLSPDLPEISLSIDEVLDMDKSSKHLMGESCKRGSSIEKETFVCSNSFSGISAEASANVSDYGFSGTLYDKTLLVREVRHNSSNTFCQTNSSYDNLESAKHSAGQIKKNGVEPRISKSLSNVGGSASSSLPAFCVVFRNANDGNISRILHVTRICMTRSYLSSQMDFKLHEILQFLRMERSISSKEKACAFFTLLLLKFSLCTCGKSGNFMDKDFFFSDSFARQLNEVGSDAKIKNLFGGICSLEDLFVLIEDFLLYGSIMVYNNIDGPTSGVQLSITLDCEKVGLSSKVASPEQLIAGSIVLSSLCVASDHIGFLCKVSYNILRVQKFDSTVLLRILHIFAYLAGEKLFSLEEYCLTMRVLSFIVLVLERNYSAVDSAICCHSLVEDNGAVFRPCVKCPFLGNPISLGIVTSMLLEKLKHATLSEKYQLHSGKLCSLSNDHGLCPGHENDIEEPVDSASHISSELHCALKKWDMLATWPSSPIDGALCNFVDLLSLVELLALYVSWEWSSSKVIPELLEVLEGSKLDNFTVALLIVLGEIGRVGVGACGYEDKAIERLRCKLSCFLWQKSTLKSSALAVQIATVGALMGLVSFVDFEGIVTTTTTSDGNLKDVETGNHQFGFALLRIRKWFSLLSKEQKELSICFFKSLSK